MNATLVAIWQIVRRFGIQAAIACLALLDANWRDWLETSLKDMPQWAAMLPIIYYIVEFAQKYIRERKKQTAGGA